MLQITVYFYFFALWCQIVLCSVDCPNVCQQMTCKVGILTCPSGGLHMIPEILPPQTTKVLLTNHKFDSSRLSYRNFSNYDKFNSMIKLTILNCSITDIDPGTFSHLSKLQTLDLSKNKIQIIQPRTFNGMSLNFLRLDENKNIMIKKYSFYGLKLKKLSLIDCDLSGLNFEGFVDISDSLERLTLTQNNLRIIDSQFSNIFRGLSDLELNNNPLDCSCDMKWLSKVLLYRKQNSELMEKEKKYDVNRARCATPQRLSNRLLYDMKDSDFVCGIPSLVELDLYIIANDRAKISCITSKNHNSRVMWTYYHQHTYKVISDFQAISFNSTIFIKKKDIIDQYYCVAQNDNGNSTAEIRIKWPSALKSNESNKTDNDKRIIVPTDQGDFFFRRQFTLLEMIGGVVGTFTGTLLLFILIYRCFIQKYRKESRKKKLYETVFYSDSQTYDIPHHTPYYHPVHTYQSSPAHYLDFKNPQVVNNQQIL